MIFEIELRHSVPQAATATATVAPEPTTTPDPRPASQVVDLPQLDAHYALDIRQLDVDSGFVDVGEIISIAASDGLAPAQLFLQVVPAHDGFFTLDAARLNGAEVTPQALNDGFTLEFDLPAGAQAPLEIALDFHLDVGTDASGWGGTARDGDALRLGYWFPIISDEHPYSDTLDPLYSRVATFDAAGHARPGCNLRAHWRDHRAEHAGRRPCALRHACRTGA